MIGCRLLKLYCSPPFELELAPPLSLEHQLLKSAILDQFQQFHSVNINTCTLNRNKNKTAHFTDSSQALNYYQSKLQAAGCVTNKGCVSQFIYQCNFSKHFKHKCSFLTVTHNFLLHVLPFLQNFFKTHILFQTEKLFFYRSERLLKSPPPGERSSLKVFTYTELPLITKFILILQWTNPRCQVASFTKFYSGARQLYVLSTEPASRQPLGDSNFRKLLYFLKKSVDPCINVSLSMSVSTVPLYSVSPTTLKLLTEESRGSPVQSGPRDLDYTRINKIIA